MSGQSIPTSSEVNTTESSAPVKVQDVTATGSSIVHAPSPPLSPPQPPVPPPRCRTLKTPAEMTLFCGGNSAVRLTNTSAFLALQSTVRNCIPVALPANRLTWDLVLEPCPATTTAFKSLHRVSSDENIAASFQVKKVHLQRVTSEQIRRWETNLTFLLSDPEGLALFEKFLESEFSQENLQFWEACEQYRRLPAKLLASEAQKIYQLYLSVQSPREVNLDSKTRLKTISLLSTPTTHLFDSAQRKIQALMEKDSYQRFLRAPLFLNFKKSVLENAGAATKAHQNSSPREQQRKSTHHGSTIIHSALPYILNVSAIPLGRKPF